MKVDVAFCRELLAKTHAMVKDADSNVNLQKDGWVYHYHGNHWEFHGPKGFYWHGSAGNAYDARHHGWLAWLEKFHPDVVE